MTPQNHSLQKMSINEARKLLARLMAEGAQIIISKHAQIRMTERDIVPGSILNVLTSNSARLLDGELENGNYRYKVETRNIGIVIAFSPMGSSIIIVTIYKK